MPLVSLLVAILGFAGNSLAQKKYIRFQHLSEQDGLSNYYVNDIETDQHGFLWIATTDGLNRYDGYTFRKWYAQSENPDALASSEISSLLVDHKQRLWVGTNYGLHVYNEESDRFLRLPHGDTGTPSAKITTLFQDAQQRIWVGTLSGICRIEEEGDSFSYTRWEEEDRIDLKNDQIGDICGGKDGRYWIGTMNGLYVYHESTDQFVFIPTTLKPAVGTMFGRLSSLLEDGEGGLWVGTGYGLRHVDMHTHKVTTYSPSKAQEHGLYGKGISDLAYDKAGRLWISTTYGGLYLYAGEGRFQGYQKNIGDQHSLASNQLVTLHLDPNGIMWLGAMTPGISYFNPNHLDKHLYRHEPQESQSLPLSVIWALWAPNDKEVWIGGDPGLVRWNRELGTFEHFVPRPDGLDDIANNRIRSILSDGKGLYLGMRRDLAYFDIETRQFRMIQQTSMTRPLKSVRSMTIDQDGILWACAYRSGFYRYDPQEDRAEIFSYRNDEHLFSSQVRCVINDAQNNLWVGTLEGLVRIDPTREKIDIFLEEDKIPANSQRNEIMSILKGPRESMWLGTHGGGLIYFDHEMGEMRYYTMEDGLPSNLIYGVLYDEDGHLWLTTEKGLVHFDPEEEVFKIFDRRYGLQGEDHNSGAHANTPDGKFLIAGPDGFNLLDSEAFHGIPEHPGTLFTGLSMNGKTVEPFRDETSVLTRPIYNMSSLEFNHLHRVFTIDFALRNQAYPRYHRFAYKLEGFDEDWVYAPAGVRSATYTNLAANRYTLKVKGADVLGNWEGEGAALDIRITPPPWRSPLAYLLYLLSFALIVWKYVAHQRSKLEHEKQIVERLRQVDKMRDDFLANTSHELRTPLNGIIGLAESLKDNPKLEEATEDGLDLIASIGKRLATLVNDILDFSQIKNQGIVLNKQDLNLRHVVSTVVTLNEATLGGKPLQLKNLVPDDLVISADENRLMQILHNLISNAIKFTPKGTVTVDVDVEPDQFLLRVQDTGIGIPSQKMDTIFKSFRQADEDVARQYGGTGLGLAITRELVQLHRGDIWVASEEGKGSIFTVSLPKTGNENTSYDRVSQVQETPGKLPAPHLQTVEEGSHIHIQTPLPSGADFHLLVVDDEPINCTVLQNHLTNYKVTTAHDGFACLEILERENIDLVLLDIMMPRLSGYEVCQRIREKHTHFELPVIFLSARNRVSDLTVGFESGANDYITKPISKGELQSRVRTHLSLLDTHRHLEERIRERTRELEAKNGEIMRAQNKLLVQEKMAYLGSLTSGIAHEIRNPLNFVHGLALASTELFEELEAEMAENPHDAALVEIVGDLKQNMNVILKHGRRAASIVEKMMDLSRDSGGMRSHFNVVRLMEDQIRLVHRNLLRSGSSLPMELITDWHPETPEPVVNSRQMGRAFTNIFKNALEAMVEKMEQHPDYKPELKLWSKTQGDYLLLGIRDNGTGIPDEIIGKIFDPFFTTRPPDSNHIGLGLSICFDIITHEHEGELQLEAKVGEYTEIRILLPCSLVSEEVDEVEAP